MVSEPVSNKMKETELHKNRIKIIWFLVELLIFCRLENKWHRKVRHNKNKNEEEKKKPIRNGLELFACIRFAFAFFFYFVQFYY